MKTVAILAAVLAVSAAVTANAMPRPQGHAAGGPIKQGPYCWVYTSPTGSGWWDLCDSRSPLPRGISRRGQNGDDFYGSFAGGSGGGGGGGGNK